MLSFLYLMNTSLGISLSIDSCQRIHLTLVANCVNEVTELPSSAASWTVIESAGHSPEVLWVYGERSNRLMLDWHLRRHRLERRADKRLLPYLVGILELLDFVSNKSYDFIMTFSRLRSSIRT